MPAQPVMQPPVMQPQLGPPPWQTVALQPPGRRPSSNRTLAIFVAAIALVVGGAAILVVAFDAGPLKPRCPDPSLPCGTPGQTPPPIAGLNTPRPTFAPAQTPRPTTRPTPRPLPSGPIPTLPLPRPPSSALPLGDEVDWTSSAFGFVVRYAPGLWAVTASDDDSILLTGWQGQVRIWIDGHPAEAPAALIPRQVDAMRDVVLGLTAETDPERVPPGQPTVGLREGEMQLLRGTLNDPAGPGAAADVVVLAAADDRVALVVTIVAPDSLREAAFYWGGHVVNAIRWPSDL
jgi:hypothetical protein